MVDDEKPEMREHFWEISTKTRHRLKNTHRPQTRVKICENVENQWTQLVGQGEVPKLFDFDIFVKFRILCAC